MPDDKRGREKQAQDADRRQRERAILEELERWDETDPPVESAALDEIDAALETIEYPATGETVVDAVGDHEIDSPAADQQMPVAALLPATDNIRFESPRAVRARLARPTMAAAMKRILEAAATLPNTTLEPGQRQAYERTLRELVAISPTDEDEGVDVLTDWIVERIRETDRLPGSRTVRKRAAEYCRSQGYEVRSDEWLGA